MAIASPKILFSRRRLRRAAIMTLGVLLTGIPLMMVLIPAQYIKAPVTIMVVIAFVSGVSNYFFSRSLYPLGQQIDEPLRSKIEEGIRASGMDLPEDYRVLGKGSYARGTAMAIIDGRALVTQRAIEELSEAAITWSVVTNGKSVSHMYRSMVYLLPVVPLFSAGEAIVIRDHLPIPYIVGLLVVTMGFVGLAVFIARLQSKQSLRGSVGTA